MHFCMPTKVLELTLAVLITCEDAQKCAQHLDSITYKFLSCINKE